MPSISNWQKLFFPCTYTYLKHLDHSPSSSCKPSTNFVSTPSGDQDGRQTLCLHAHIFSPDQKSTHVLRWLVQACSWQLDQPWSCKKEAHRTNKWAPGASFFRHLPRSYDQIFSSWAFGWAVSAERKQGVFWQGVDRSLACCWRAAGAQANICLLVTQRFLSGPSLFSGDVRLADSAAAVVSHGISKAMASESEFLAHGKGDWVN